MNNTKPKYVLKNIHHEPILPILKTYYKKTDFYYLSMFFVGYSNRIMCKSAKEIRDTFAIPYNLNTIHIRYLLILYFFGESKKSLKYASLKQIEFGDFPARTLRSHYRIKYMQDLVTHGLCIELKPHDKATYYQLTDKGHLALAIIKANIKLTIHCHPAIGVTKDMYTPLKIKKPKERKKKGILIEKR